MARLAALVVGVPLIILGAFAGDFTISVADTPGILALFSGMSLVAWAGRDI